MFGPVFPINRNSLELCSSAVDDTLGLTDNLGFVRPRMSFVGTPAGMVVFPMCTFSWDRSLKSRANLREYSFSEENWGWQWRWSWKENILDFCILLLWVWLHWVLSRKIRRISEYCSELGWGDRCSLLTSLKRGCLRTGPWRLFFGTHTCCPRGSIRICLLIFGFVPGASYLVYLDSLL